MVGGVVSRSCAASAVEMTSDMLEKIIAVSFQMKGFSYESQRKYPMLSQLTKSEDAGPLLAELLKSQRASEDLFGSFNLLSQAVEALVLRVGALDCPLVWPVGDSSERLSGAAVFASQGAIRLRGWSETMEGEPVLLLVVNHSSDLSLSEAADHARNLGASEVHVCRVESAGRTFEAPHGMFDSYHSISIGQRPELALAS